jgi:hypothetical protein
VAPSVDTVKKAQAVFDPQRGLHTHHAAPEGNQRHAQRRLTNVDPVALRGRVSALGGGEGDGRRRASAWGRRPDRIQLNRRIFLLGHRSDVDIGRNGMSAEVANSKYFRARK